MVIIIPNYRFSILYLFVEIGRHDDNMCQLMNLVVNKPRHRGTGPFHVPLGSHSTLDGPFNRYPHEHLNTARPYADVFSSVKLKCGSSKNSEGHWMGLHAGGGDDQFPVRT